MPTPEKDPRVYFAAERTLLAWIRTGIALMGFGFVVARFGLFLRELRVNAGGVPGTSTGVSLWAGTALVLIGVIVDVLSSVRYVRVVRQLNEGQDITTQPSKMGIIIALSLAAIGVAVAIYLLLMR